MALIALSTILGVLPIFIIALLIELMTSSPRHELRTEPDCGVLTREHKNCYLPKAFY